MICALRAAALALVAVCASAISLEAAAQSSSPDLAWRLLGPFRGGWSEMVVGAPSEPDTFYFGASGGGVWRTRNAGRTWNSVFDQGPTAPIGAVAVAPSDPKIIYIGSGQPEPRYDVSSGSGVFKSVDGGDTWQALGLADTRHIGRIWIDPADANTVLVAAVGHFFGPNSQRGVFRSRDGGKTWAQTLKPDNDTGAVDLASDPLDSKVLFAATWQARQYPWQSYFTPVAGPGSGVYKSLDGGVTWTRLSGSGWPEGALGRISVATTRTPSGLRVYAVVSDDKAGGLYRSDDGGGSWARVNDGQAFINYYASRVTVAPDNPDMVYLVGQSVRRCADGGKTCEIIRGAPGGDDYHHVWINPAHPDHMATASDQGTAISVDGGKTWSSWYNQPTGQFYHLGADNGFPYKVYAGQQDSGTVSIATHGDYGDLGEREWRPVGGEERDYELPDPNDPGIVYGTGLGGAVTRWDARTAEVSNISPYLEANYGRRQTTTAHRFVWVTPLAVTRTGPTVIFLGGDVVFASHDQGHSWSVISPDLTGKAAGAKGCDAVAVAVADATACGYGGIWSMATSSRNPNELWVGTDNGLIQRTSDGGGHWTNVTPPNLPSWAKVASIDLSDLADGVAYAAIDNQRLDDFEPHALKTHDAGATWQDASGDLPKGHFVSVVRADPRRAGLLYAGTEVGAFVSLDDGAHWRPLQKGLPTAWVRDLLVHGDDLVAATQGRGLWVMDDIAPLRETVAASGEKLHLYAPAPAYRIQANVDRGDTPVPPEEPRGVNPPAGALIDYWLAEPAKGPVEIEIRDAAGALVQRMTSEAPPKLDAERYFAAAWLEPARSLSQSSGFHRAIWNLRYTRPAALSFGYSIAANPGVGAPLSPEGAFVVPGEYQVVLKVDGRTAHQAVRVLADPRARLAPGDLEASLALSKRIADSLALSRRGYLERVTLHDELEATSKASNQTQALRDRIKALAVQTGDAGDSHLKAANGALARIEADLESADRAPTAPQVAAVDAEEKRVASDYAGWAALRDGPIASLNQAMKTAGLTPATLPAPDQLKGEPEEEEGGDLP